MFHDQFKKILFLLGAPFILGATAFADFSKTFKYMGQTEQECLAEFSDLVEHVKALSGVHYIDSGCEEQNGAWDAVLNYSANDPIKFVSTVADFANSYSPEEGYHNENDCKQNLAREQRQFVAIFGLDPILKGCYYNPFVRLYGIRFVTIGETNLIASSIGFSLYGETTQSYDVIQSNLAQALKQFPDLTIRSTYVTGNMAYDQIVARYFATQKIYANQANDDFKVLGATSCHQISEGINREFIAAKKSALAVCQKDALGIDGAQDLTIVSFAYGDDAVWLANRRSSEFYQSKAECDVERNHVTQTSRNVISSFCYEDSENGKKFRYGILSDRN